MILIESEYAESKAWLCSSTQSGISSSDDEWWKVDVNGVGRRMLMNDITAALGVCQLERLPDFIKRRKQIYDIYNSYLGVVPWLLLPPPLDNNVKSSYYFYWIQLSSRQRRNDLAKYLRSAGIYSTFRYWPLHKIPFFEWPESVPLIGAEHAAMRTLDLPLHQALTNNEIKFICDTIIEYGENQRWK